MPLKSLAWAFLLVAVSGAAHADNTVQITIDPTSGRQPISPYIYGTNQDLPGVASPGARRFGGDRLTGYNWETNASNAGNDYIDNSDNYLVASLPASEQSIPAVALTSFHQQSLTDGTPYTVLTLQMAGYVAADENGPVTAAQAAPSSRWNVVVNNTPGGAFPPTPNLADGTVYMDEVLYHILGQFGPGVGSTGVKGYDLDNEPSLWPSTHPYLHPAQTTCAEIVSKSTALAKTIKRMDPTADVLGGVFYGSAAYFTFQSAPDWASIQNSTGDRWFLDYFLAQMSSASATAGTRLMDVLDLHRYSDENVSGTGPDQSITQQTNYADTATDMDRVQAPRVLWDPTYIENSWVQQYYSQFLPWIPNIQASIAARYPGTKLSFTEYSYGGESDISGGLAQADVLGIYGKYGVYLGCVWILHGSPAPLYTAAAFNLYLDYDGQGGRFGSTSVSETDSDIVNTSAYASVDAAGALHVVVLNKSYTAPADLTFQIGGSSGFSSANVYAFDASTTNVTARSSGTVAGNRMTYTLAPLTAAHFVFQSSGGAPAFASGPSSQTVASGATAVFTAAANASAYQWELNGSALVNGTSVSGATGPELVINSVTGASAGTYTCVATNTSGSTTSPSATLTVNATSNPGRLVNISCRAQVGTGPNILIAGFVVGGAGTSGQESLLIRGSGPALIPFKVSGTLPDPQLQLISSANAVLGTSEGWGGNAQIAAAAASVNAFTWMAASSHDAALLEGLPVGAYTAQVAGQSGDTGVALAEVYDTTPAGTYAAATPRLVNISTRAQVGTGGNILIAGFVIGGTTAETVLVRASGPALVPFKVSGTLADPQLKLYQSNPDGSSTLLQTNTGWGGDPEIAAEATRVAAFSWGSSATPDSALLLTLPPGAYTAQVAGASGDTGIALIEVYEVQ